MLPPALLLSSAVVSCPSSSSQCHAIFPVSASQCHAISCPAPASRCRAILCPAVPSRCPLTPALLRSVVIMSSILEHMCADVLQQTATQIKFPSTGMDTIPYWNLLPPKKPIKEVLTGVFTKVLEKGWVDSRSIHIFDTLLHMGGVYWFCNNLVKVRGGRRDHQCWAGC